MPELLIGEESALHREGQGHWLWIPTLIYLMVVLFLMVRFIYGWYFIENLKSKAAIKGYFNQKYPIYELKKGLPSFSWIRSIFIQESDYQNESEFNQILNHEAAHVVQRHSYDIIYIKLFTAFLWFIPGIRSLEKAIKENHEFLADQIVVKQFNVKWYQKLLARHCLQRLPSPAGSFFAQSINLKRLKQMEKKSNSKVWACFAVCIPALILAILLNACVEGFNEEQDEFSPKTGEESMTIVETSELDEVFTIVEDAPVPKGGMDALYVKIGENLEYPSEAKQNGIEGKVFIEFIINKEGKLIQPSIVKGVDPSLDQAALNLFQSLDHPWEPGKQKDEAVNVRLVLPITFKLDNNG